MTRRAVLVSLVAIASLAVCSSSSDDVVAVSASDTECDAAKTDFTAGKVTFEVKNDGSKVTELYVYASGDRVISEVENVGPGASRQLTVDLKAGEYELACKPGQTGTGIRTPIKVTGAGGAEGGAAVTPDRTVELRTKDYEFQLADPKIKVGEAIQFTLHNDGLLEHEFEVFPPDSDEPLGEVEAVKPGEVGSATLEFDKAGTYRYECHVGHDTADDHFEKGMKGTFEVT